jgi:hypothetical protein
MTEVVSRARSTSAGATMRAAPNLSRVAWTHADDMDYPEWIAAGRRLGAIGRGSQWWIGDWLLFGAAKFGERYVEASRVTGYDPKSLRNMRYVASRFPVSLRRDDLEWSHHALLAAFEPEKQKSWLERAAVDRLSVSDLRCELKAEARSGDASLEPVDSDAAKAASAVPDVMIVCPNCGAQVPLGEDQHGLSR